MSDIRRTFKPAFLLVCLLALPGCFSQLHYQTELETVEVDRQSFQASGGVYHDDNVIISTLLDNTLKILIANNSDRTLRVVWDESRFVDPLGDVHRVLPAGVRYIARHDVLSPAIILPKQTFKTILTNSDNVRLVNEGTSAMEWQDRGMLPSTFAMIDGDPKKVADRYVGKMATLHLVMDQDGIRREYKLAYKIMSYK